LDENTPKRNDSGGWRERPEEFLARGHVALLGGLVIAKTLPLGMLDAL
jgi:hypothetical protein